MNKLSTRLAFVFATLVLGLLLLNTAHAMGSKSAISKQAALQQSYTWHDGDKTRTVWLNPRLIAEFDLNQKNRSAVMAAYASAEEVPSRHGSIRIWKLTNTVTVKAAIKTLKSSSANGKYSPILHDSPSSSGRMRALPGNIIVHLDPSWGQDLIESWLRQNNLEVVRKLNIGPNIFVIKTDPGIAALDTANKLYDAGIVVAAYPDWWKEVGTR